MASRNIFGNIRTGHKDTVELSGYFDTDANGHVVGSGDSDGYVGTVSQTTCGLVATAELLNNDNGVYRLTLSEPFPVLLFVAATAQRTFPAAGKFVPKANTIGSATQPTIDLFYEQSGTIQDFTNGRVFFHIILGNSQ